MSLNSALRKHISVCQARKRASATTGNISRLPRRPARSQRPCAPAVGVACPRSPLAPPALHVPHSYSAEQYYFPPHPAQHSTVPAFLMSTNMVPSQGAGSQHNHYYAPESDIERSHFLGMCRRLMVPDLSLILHGAQDKESHCVISCFVIL